MPHTALSVSTSTGKLNGEAFSHKIGSMKGWDNIAGVHCVLVLDEAEAIHQLYFGNLSGTVGRKVSLDIGLGSMSREVPQVQPGGRNLSHGGQPRVRVW